MGNCLFGGMVDHPGGGGGAITVTTSNGGVMEFYPPISAGNIAGEFPGYAIFPCRDLFWKPLSDAEELLPGGSYYLLPLAVGDGHVRSSSVPPAPAAPYRMSFDCQGTLLRRSCAEVFPSRAFSDNHLTDKESYGSVGFWKVKLVISPEQLLEILSQECKTQELIESVRTVGRCGGNSGGAALSGGFSDEWSLSNESSSRNGASTKVNGLMV